ncbi:MAG: ATPase [Candidatus Reconcilbacillus cellulovorans]|uniref:ATPase n=1 Tax=Candidatus Reconcilbacillus cellulovorans TaxID=1906605 RepID=A0A2A6E409_9BACL|nr:MAG: ATPase [Candidatus Reconcilbacillus cellulovorans]
MLRLGQKVIIVADTFEQNLPIGEYGYIIAYDRNADTAFDYVVRVPKYNKQVLVPAQDIELEETLLAREAERIEREALIDYALATRNEELFRKVMSEAGREPLVDKAKVQSREDFIRQINLKAWI